MFTRIQLQEMAIMLLAACLGLIDQMAGSRVPIWIIALACACAIFALELKELIALAKAGKLNG
jgi:hypothetical protein